MRISLEPAIIKEGVVTLLLRDPSAILSLISSAFSISFAQKLSIDRMAGIETPSSVSVQITSSMTSFTSEKRLQRSETISTLKVLWICILLFFLFEFS